MALPGSRSCPLWVEEKLMTTIRGLLGQVLSGLLIMALGGFCAWYFGPLLIRDFGIGANVEPAGQARVVDGRCKAKLIVYWCDIKVDYTYSGIGRRSELYYLFVDLPMADHSIRLLSGKADRSVVTSDIGQQMLWNRAITLGVFLACCLSPLVILPLNLSRRMAARKAAALPG
jgi:hypothetical protein